MKRTFYTLAFVAFFTLMSNAQSAEPAKAQDPKKETVNTDGTLAPAQATSAQNDDAQKADRKPAGGTRMAITEKGVPASKTTEQKPKATEQKKTEPAKNEKH